MVVETSKIPVESVVGSMGSLPWTKRGSSPNSSPKSPSWPKKLVRRTVNKQKVCLFDLWQKVHSPAVKCVKLSNNDNENITTPSLNYRQTKFFKSAFPLTTTLSKLIRRLIYIEILFKKLHQVRMTRLLPRNLSLVRRLYSRLSSQEGLLMTICY